MLLAIYFKQHAILRYFLEEIKLNPAVYLVKPDTKDEIFFNRKLKKIHDAQEKKDLNKYKIKLSRYNRIISIIIACKNQSETTLEYLIENPLLKYFWTK